MSNSENNKRIAKNTLLLYFRMLLTMFVSLYTVRVVINALGVVDYGIYNVVGGIVVMFSFLSNTMASASQRFFAFELGQNQLEKLKQTFSLTVTIYIIISLVVLILAETIGLWILNKILIIPQERMEAANWIYQFSILSFITTIMTIPYNAAIIARENMSVYAYVSIFEVILKLIIVYLLVLFSFDKLKLYGILLFTTTCLTTYIYRTICIKKYEECRFKFYWNKKLFHTLISFSGWNLFGAVAGVMNNQGINILLNIFFGPIVNAARGIAFQVNAAVNLFVMNFHTAVKPQITKYYAAGDKEKMMILVFQSSKFSYFLIFILSMLFILETHFILELWLKNVPEYVVLFTRLVIINALIDSLTYSMQTAAQATGKIKMYQFVVGGMLLLNLPISYMLLKIGFPPQATLYTSIIISTSCLFVRLFMLKYLIKLQLKEYIYNVLGKIVIVSIIAYLIPILIINNISESLTRFIITGIIGFATSIISVYVVGLTINEKKYIEYIINNKIKKIFK